MKSEELAGTWRIISCEARSSKGEVRYPYGKNPAGILMYDSGGNMSVLVVSRDRPNFASGNLLKGTPKEVKAAFEGSLAYCGTYEVDEAKETVTHHVEGSTFPNWVGTDLVRLFECSRDQLVLSTPRMPSGDEHWVVRLTWKRTKKQKGTS